MDQELERKLREYLGSEDSDYPGAKEELRGVRNEVREYAAKMHEHFIDDVREHSSARAELKLREAGEKEAFRRIEALEAAAEVTGITNVAELREKYRNTKTELAEQHKFVRGWFFGMLGSAVIGVVAWAFKKLFG
jgi:hypothetical protein